MQWSKTPPQTGELTNGTVPTSNKTMTENVTDEVPESRHWESQWYRTKPQSFEHFELFYDPDQILLVFAGESYKSFLLRRDGREEYATEVGENHRDRSATEILSEERNESIPLSAVTEINLRPGSLLWKPKQQIVTADKTYDFYHYSRKYDIDGLTEELEKKYPEIDVSIN